MLDERGDVVAPLAQRGQAQRDDVEAVVEIFTELALGDQLVDVAMGRGHEPHVEGDELAPAQAANLVLLEDAEQIDLGLGGHLADFVEEERAPLGHLEPAGLAPGRAAEGPFLVAEQLALDQAFGQCPDVGGDEWPGPAPAQVVDGAGHQLLARAAFPLDQDGQVGIGDLADAREHLADGGALADHFRELAGGGQPFAQQPVLLAQAVVLESLHAPGARASRGRPAWRGNRGRPGASPRRPSRPSRAR